MYLFFWTQRRENVLLFIRYFMKILLPKNWFYVQCKCKLLLFDKRFSQLSQANEIRVGALLIIRKIIFRVLFLAS